MEGFLFCYGNSFLFQFFSSIVKFNYCRCYYDIDPCYDFSVLNKYIPYSDHNLIVLVYHSRIQNRVIVLTKLFRCKHRTLTWTHVDLHRITEFEGDWISLLCIGYFLPYMHKLVVVQCFFIINNINAMAERRASIVLETLASQL